MMNAHELTAALGGKWHGRHGFVCCPSHEDKTPSCKLWDHDGEVMAHCFAGCEWQSIKDTLRQRGLLPEIGEHKTNGVVPPYINGAQEPSEQWHPIMPIPENAGDAPTHAHLGKPSARWAYRDKRGILMIVCRWDKDGSKTIRPLTYCQSSEGEQAWRWAGLSGPKPLYNLDKLQAGTGATINMVEGEKAADAATQLFPGEIATTWPHGRLAVKDTDYSPLKGCRVLIWPDNDRDGGGREAAQEAARQCTEAEAAEVRIVEIPEDWPDKWDLADPVPEGESGDILERLRRDAKSYSGSRVAGSSPADSGKIEPPEPLLGEAHEAIPYPIDHLPELIQRAVLYQHEYGQQPLPMVAGSALAACSLACQGLADVRRDEMLLSPISLNIMAVAESGERKTALDRALGSSVRAWLEDRRQELAPEKARAEAEMLAWETEVESLKKKLAKAASGNVSVGAQADSEQLKGKLAELYEKEPSALVMPDLFSSDTTPEGLLGGLRGWPSQSLWSDEAGNVIGGHGMSDEACLRFFALLNKLWDGDPISRKRGTTESYTVKGRRFTANLMAQEIVLQRLLSVGGGAGRGTGFLARTMLIWPESTIGTRKYRPPQPENPALEDFHARLRELLNIPLTTEGDDMALKPMVLSLDNEAHRLWVEFHDDVESNLGDMEEFADVRDFGSKAAENAARIAAIFHVIERGPHGSITARDVERGCAVASWHLWEARRLLKSFTVPEHIEAAQALLNWIIVKGQTKVSPKDIAQFGPYRFRGTANRRARDAGLDTLLGTRHLIEDKAGRRTVFILNPHLERAA